MLKMVLIMYITAGEDFTPGRYNVTFTAGASTATTSIPILINNMNDNETEQFDLNLYIDGTGYQLCLDKGKISKATASISGEVLLLQIHRLAISYIHCTISYKDYTKVGFSLLCLYFYLLCSVVLMKLTCYIQNYAHELSQE